MKVPIIVKVNGRDVSEFQEEVSTRNAFDFEQRTERLKDRLG